MDVAGEAVELGDNDSAAYQTRLRQRGFELRPAIQCIRPLAGLDLLKLAGKLDPLGLGEASDRLTLSVEAETRLALLSCRDPEIRDGALENRFALLPNLCNGR
jgi:hypothetical protein